MKAARPSAWHTSSSQGTRPAQPASPRDSGYFQNPTRLPGGRASPQGSPSNPLEPCRGADGGAQGRRGGCWDECATRSRGELPMCPRLTEPPTLSHQLPACRVAPGNAACPSPSAQTRRLRPWAGSDRLRANTPPWQWAPAPGRSTRPPAPEDTPGLPGRPAPNRPPRPRIISRRLPAGQLPAGPASSKPSVRSQGRAGPSALPTQSQVGQPLPLERAQPWPLHSPLPPPPSPPPLLPPAPSPSLFFSYIRCLKMALFKSIRHILQCEKGHVALLRARAPPPYNLV